MAIFNKKKKTEEKKFAEVKIQKPAAKKEIKIATKHSTENYRIVKYPHVTEKATNLAEKNQYVFNIGKDANKIEVKKAMESLYKVNVLGVNIINIHPRKRRLGKTMGHIPGYKKAIVKIEEGQKIEVLPK
jgi:large subunit ribosomal protein L23